MAIKGFDPDGRLTAARARRRSILDVAAEAFASRGWTGTTLAQVAEESGESPEQVAAAFGDEASLLMAAFRRASFGDYDNLQAAFAGLRIHDDHAVDERLDLIVDFARQALSSMAPMIPALQQAAVEDTRVRELVDVARARRRRTSAEIVAMVTRGAASHPDAVDLVYLLMSGETYLQYTGELGHSPDDFARWLRRSVDRAVNG